MALAAVYEAPALAVRGPLEIVSDLDALFLLAGESDAFTWELDAERVILQRTIREVPVSFYLPGSPESPWIFASPFDPRIETSDLTAARLTASTTPVEGGLLARGTPASEATTSARQVVDVQPVVNPEIDQNGDETATVGDNPLLHIRAELEGSFLALQIDGAELVIVGDLTIDLYGGAYAVASEELSREERTGYYATTDVGLVKQERDERHTIYAFGATLRVSASQLATLFAEHPTITSGSALQLPTIGSVPVDPATGSASLTLANAGGMVRAVGSEATVASSGARVAQGPQVALLSALGAIVALAAGVALVVRHRRARADDLEIALLAMEERRWNDALPRLTRVAREQPGNAGVQIDRALCLEQLGRFAEAAKAFEHALRSAPRHAEAHFYYARTLAKMRQPEAARAHLEAALERDPRLAELARGELILRGI